MQSVVERVLDSFEEKNFEFTYDPTVGRYPQTIAIWGRSGFHDGHWYSCRLQYSDLRNTDEFESAEVCRCEVWENAYADEKVVFDFDLSARYRYVQTEEAQYSWRGRELRPARFAHELIEPLSDDFVRLRDFVRNLAEQLIAETREIEKLRLESNRRAETELQIQLREKYWSSSAPRNHV
jgi:hypothetical protein